MQLSGNKVRKLEFLMAEAKAEGADCVITLGGIQSNHCRATAVAARYLNLDCYLILRTSRVGSATNFCIVLLGVAFDNSQTLLSCSVFCRLKLRKILVLLAIYL